MDLVMIFRATLLLASLIFVRRSRADCRSAIDIGIMLDSSTSVGKSHFEAAKRFSEDLVSALDVGPAKQKIGLIHFNYATHLDFGFSAYEFPDDVVHAIRNVNYHPGSASLDQALGFAEKHLFNQTSGMRDRLEAPVKILIILTDGIIPQDARPIDQILNTYLTQDTFIYRLIVKTGFSVSEPDLLILADYVEENIVEMVPQSLQTLVNLVETRAEHFCNLLGF